MGSSAGNAPCKLRACETDRKVLVARHEQEKAAMLKHMGWLHFDALQQWGVTDKVYLFKV